MRKSSSTPREGRFPTIRRNGPRNIGNPHRADAAEAARLAAYFLAKDDPVGEEEHLDQWGGSMRPVKINASEFQAHILAAFPMPSRPTVLDKSIFGDVIKAHLVFFYLGPVTRLAWQVEVVMPESSGQYLLIVSADSIGGGEILYCAETTHYVAARGNIFTHNPSLTPRTIVDFPRPRTDYPVLAPAGMSATFGDWVEVDQALGNLTHATLGNTGNTIKGQLSNGVVEFRPAEEFGDDQKVLNIFYFCNYMHDFFYLLGFDELSGSFQKKNPPGVPGGRDEVLAFSHPGAVNGTANMSTPPDGQNPIMNMGLVIGTNRHTAFDSDVVFHEFVHGVTNRLVGGRLNDQALRQPQSRGQGEGWSDYFALTIQNFGKPTEKVVTGDWVTGRVGGIRGFPYNSSFPDGFGSLGSGRYTGQLPDGRPSPHPIGEIWCATLMQINRAVGAALGNQDRAHQLCWQLVVDGLKLSPSNPSFLDSRNSILQALDDMKATGRLPDPEYATIRRVMWQTFAHFGMGVNASSNGASVLGIVADKTLPVDLQPGPIQP